jgi:hypothetical protein
VLKTQVLAITGGTHGTLVGLYRNLEGYSNSETSSGFIADNPDFGRIAVQNDTPKEFKDESLMEVFEESHASPTSNDNHDDTGKMIMLISRRLSDFRTLMGFK